MSSGRVVAVRPPAGAALPTGRARPALLAGSVAVLVLVLAPPLSTLARHYQVAQAVQFAALAVVVPALAVLGAPWSAGGRRAPGRWLHRGAQRRADARRRHPQAVRAGAEVAAGLAVIVGCHTPAVVDAVARHGALLLVQAVVLVAAGATVWLECVVSPPLAPRWPALSRAVAAACAMWVLWTMAYLVAMSRAPWYPALHHAGGLSAAADAQLASIVLWLAATACFVPAVFANALRWLRDDEDPDTELHRLARDERRRAAPPGLPRPDGPGPEG